MTCSRKIRIAREHRVNADMSGASNVEDVGKEEDLRQASNTSLSSESAYSSNGNTAPLPNPHLHRKESVRSYRLRRRLKKKKQMQRLVGKDGFCKVVHTHIKYKGITFMSDIFTTLIDLKWRWMLTVFTMSYVVGWFLFGILWFLIAAAHGDLAYQNRTDADFYEPCVLRMDSFTASFLFSIETQTTIGYGYRTVTERCPVAVFVVVIQSVFSCLIDAAMIGCVFAKIARPKKRAATVRFSRNAVIAQRDGKLCFMFRVGDIRMSHLYESHLRVYLIKPKITLEGEIIPIHHYNMDIGFETGEDRIFLVWPLLISHVIDENSPLYEYSFADLQSADFEIIVILEGIVEQTGLTTQARTSYLPQEILWGHRFSTSVVCLRNESDKQYSVDYSKFDDVYPVPEMTKLSAKTLEEQDDDHEEEINTELFMECMQRYMNNILKKPSMNGLNGSRDDRLREEVIRRRYRTLSSGDARNRNSDPLLVGKDWHPVTIRQESETGDFISGSAESMKEPLLADDRRLEREASVSSKSPRESNV